MTEEARLGGPPLQRAIPTQPADLLARGTARRARPAQLRLFDAPGRQEPQLAAFVERVVVTADEIPDRQAVSRVLERAVQLVPAIATRAAEALFLLADAAPAEVSATYVPRPLSPELRAVLDAPPAGLRPDERLVGQVLRDL